MYYNYIPYISVQFSEIPLKYVHPVKIFCQYQDHESYQILLGHLQPELTENTNIQVQ